MEQKIIAVDFDGCLVTNNFPNIGIPITETIEALKAEQANGTKTILWTCRVDERLSEAVQWCSDNNIKLDAVNDNLPEMIEAFGNNCRKVFANEYWDDRAVVKPEAQQSQPARALTATPHVFISQPMAGKSETEILEERSGIEESLRARGFCIANSVFEQEPKCANIPLGYLAMSIELLAKCDRAVFMPGWENARGCKIEHDCCVAYGIPVEYYDRQPESEG